jgi:hypothetical protein
MRLDDGGREVLRSLVELPMERERNKLSETFWYPQGVSLQWMAFHVTKSLLY